LRACYPRDICKIVACINAYEERPPELSLSDLERATTTYFAENAPNARVQPPPLPATTQTNLGNLALAVQNFLPMLPTPIT
jgi:hypothetical protein